MAETTELTDLLVPRGRPGSAPSPSSPMDTAYAAWAANPTAENIARWIVDTVPCCYKAEVWESRDNMACYERDDVED